MKNYFCKANFVYIYDMSGEVERIRTPLHSLPIIAYFEEIVGGEARRRKKKVV